MQSDQLLNLLKETGAMMEGHFLLTSGRHSNIYIEKFRILENPISLSKVCSSMAEVVVNKKIDIVLGAAIGGILLSGGIGRHLNKTHIFSERINGEMQLRRGFSINEGDEILIVEDIVTTGGSVFELIELVKSFNGKVSHIVNLVNRTSKDIDFGFPSTALLNIPSESWELKDCPLCKNGIPLTERGRSGKKVEVI